LLRSSRIIVDAVTSRFSDIIILQEAGRTIARAGGRVSDDIGTSGFGERNMIWIAISCGAGRGTHLFSDSGMSSGPNRWA
jgi:hypothetical protein